VGAAPELTSDGERIPLPDIFRLAWVRGDGYLMRIIVGLGNPGREYANTRHNLGFMVVDELARRLGAGGSRKRFRSEIAEGTLDGAKIVLVKPQTYMNLSGYAVREVVNWYHVARDGLLVVLDDLDLPGGAIRLRADGSGGGHNGLTSVLEQLGSHAVPRMRIGIGRGPSHAVAQVLSRFSPEEERALPAVVAAAADCAILWAREGMIAAMNRCNRRDATEPATPAPASP
jgi:PTH1 family peptidyl-tRNA hydrolase